MTTNLGLRGRETIQQQTTDLHGTATIVQQQTTGQRGTTTVRQQTRDSLLETAITTQIQVHQCSARLVEIVISTTFVSLVLT